MKEIFLLLLILIFKQLNQGLVEPASYCKILAVCSDKTYPYICSTSNFTSIFNNNTNSSIFFTYSNVDCDQFYSTCG
jgi:hypothetical protein